MPPLVTLLNELFEAKEFDLKKEISYTLIVPRVSFYCKVVQEDGHGGIARDETIEGAIFKALNYSKVGQYVEKSHST